MSKAKEFLEKKGARALLADQMGVTRQSVSLWLTGQTKPNVKNIIRMSKALTELGVPSTPSDILILCNEAREDYEAANPVEEG